MPIDYTRGNAQLSGMEIIKSNFENIEKEFYDVLYLDRRWRKVIPMESIDNSINPGAASTSYIVQDVSGSGGFVSANSGQVPTIDRSYSKPVTISLAVGRLTATFDDDEIRSYQYGYGVNFRNDLPRLMAEACDRHVEGVVFYGFPELGFESWMDYPECDTIEAALNAASTSRSWFDKTADEILKDINDAITHVWGETNEVHIPDHMWLPSNLFSLINSKRITDIDKTVLRFVQENNLYTAATGKQLTIQSIPHLRDTGTDGNGRVVFEEHLGRNHFLPFPIPFMMKPPFQAEYGIKLLAEYKFGSYHNRYPKSMVYLDFPTV